MTQAQQKRIEALVAARELTSAGRTTWDGDTRGRDYHETTEALKAALAALSSAPPVSLRLVLKCAERSCIDDNTDAALDYVREAIRHVDKSAPAPPVAETPPTRARVWTGPGELERTGYIGPGCGVPPASPVVAPAPVVEEAPYCERHGTMRANDEMGRLWSCDCQTAEPCPCGNGYVYTPNHTALVTPTPQPAEKRMVMCRSCDGCGWYEGGPTLQTTCAACKGTGEVPDVDVAPARVEPPPAREPVDLMGALRKSLDNANAADARRKAKE